MYSENSPYDESPLKKSDVASVITTKLNVFDLIKEPSFDQSSTKKSTDREDPVAQILGTFDILPQLLSSTENSPTDDTKQLQDLLSQSKSSDPIAVSNLLELSQSNPELFGKWMEPGRIIEQGSRK